MHNIKVTIKATEIATGKDVVSLQSLEVENEGQVAGVISRTLFTIGQTGIVAFDATTRVFRLYQPRELSNLTAQQAVIIEPTLSDIRQVVTA